MTDLPRPEGVGRQSAAIGLSPHLSPIELVLAALCVIAGIAAIVVNTVGLIGWLS